MAALKVYNGTSWVPAVGKVYNGTTWEEKMAYYNGTAWVDLYTSLSVQLPAISLSAFSFGSECYSGIKIDANGSIYKHPTGGSATWSDTGEDWLLVGSNTEVWVEASFLAGTGSPSLFSSSATATRLACTTDRYWRIRDAVANNGEITGTLDLYLYDAATGGNLIASRSYTLDADYSTF